MTQYGTVLKSIKEDIWNTTPGVQGDGENHDTEANVGIGLDFRPKGPVLAPKGTDIWDLDIADPDTQDDGPTRVSPHGDFTPHDVDLSVSSGIWNPESPEWNRTGGMDSSENFNIVLETEDQWNSTEPTAQLELEPSSGDPENPESYIGFTQSTDNKPASVEITPTAGIVRVGASDTNKAYKMQHSFSDLKSAVNWIKGVVNVPVDSTQLIDAGFVEE